MLKKLPGAKQIDAFYHTSGRLETDQHLIGRILKSNGDPISLRRPTSQTTPQGSSSQSQTPPTPPSRPRQRKKPGSSESEIPERKASSQSEISSAAQEPVEASWCRAVVGIAFGGLVPQASLNLAKAVEFTVGGEICDCIDELENLINRLHLQNKHLNLFGAFISERASTEEAVDHVFYATPSHYMDTQEATASFARYMNLVERMAAQFVIVPPSSPRHVVGNPNRNSRNAGQSRQDMLFEASYDLVQEVYVEAVRQYRKEMEKIKTVEVSEGVATTTTTIVEPTAPGATETNSEPSRVSPVKDKIGDAVREISNRVERNEDITLEDAALVVRCVLAVWASRVLHVEGDDVRETESREEETSAPRRRRPASLDDLPQLMAFA